MPASSTQIWIGNDHGGHALKHTLVAYLEERGIACKDVGSDSGAIVRYPHYAVRVAQAVSQWAGVLVAF